MLWVDRYRPKTFAEIELHPELTSVLGRLAQSRDLPHLLFYGPPGSGKKTRVMAVLNAIYGPKVYALRLEHKSVQVTDHKVVDLTTLSSPHHIDLNPSDAGSYDRVVVMQMIREIAQTAPMATPGSGTGVGYKVVVLNEVDGLSRGAQHALRRTMERYLKTCRLILTCTSTSRLIAPLRSRCLALRVPAHSSENLAKALSKVCQAEGLATPSAAFLRTLSLRSEGNLRRGLLMLEAAVATKVDFAGDGSAIPQPDWKLYLDEIAGDILGEQSPKKLHEIRLKFYDLLAQCISGDTILKTLVNSLFATMAPKLHGPLIELAARYDHNMKLGTKPILHLEAFVAGVMTLLKENASLL
ncbi:unnamed protein product [Phytomonas sp. Hart1]|nr:unnamed protein product [Phytomonas sp. Hart1]|eukprot:CCW70088.1 unnamed protein product [Phytomonas sp. isolate Hart1]